MARYIVLLGPPGAGKGTQAKRISTELGLVHISSGDIFRENLKNKTELGELAKQYIDRGELVPDDVTIAMIKERLQRPDCEQGALLDGFPRTPVQANELDNLLGELNSTLEMVMYIEVPDEVLIDRLAGRWTCRAQGHVFHEKFSPPKVVGICDYDGSEIYQRPDDQRETVMNRIEVYQAQTKPLIDYYQQNGKLIVIDGTQAIEQVGNDLLEALSKG